MQTTSRTLCDRVLGPQSLRKSSLPYPVKDAIVGGTEYERRVYSPEEPTIHGDRAYPIWDAWTQNTSAPPTALEEYHADIIEVQAFVHLNRYHDC